MVWFDSVTFIDFVMKTKVKCIKYPVIFFCFLLYIFPECMLSGQSIGYVAKSSKRREGYSYEAAPVKNRDSSRSKSIEMNIDYTDYQTIFTMKSISDKEVEYITIELDADGNFASGTRNVTNPSGKSKSEDSMWKKQKTVYTKRRSGRGQKTREFDLPENKILAVDGSLLLLLRSFPFDQNREWKLFLIDFSQHSVSGIVRQAGVETIHVKAGEFECYRMEVIIHAFIFRPKITYWITKMEPHFLVKHRGKIGPFTKTYTTQLVSID
jgi:hypothetical protein